MNSVCRRQHTQSGFTLVELLVAITILAMVLASVTGTVSISSKMANNISERAHSVDRQIQIRSFVKRQLQQASTVLVAEKDGKEHIAFSGAPRSLSFVAALPESSAVAGLHRQTLQVEEHDDGESLVLLYEPFLPQLRPDDWIDDGGREVLLEGMELIEFSYFGAETGTSWSENWANTMRLPDLIQIRILSRDRDVWPNIVAAPRIDSQRSSSSIGSG